MMSAMDYRAYPILYVDDEVTNLQSMRYLLDDRFTLITTASPDEALKTLASDDIAVLLTDQRMPGMTGTELCAKARELKPDTVRILITAYADLHAAIDAVNRGQVRRYLSKPHSEEELVEALRTAIDFFHLQRTVRDMEIRVIRSGNQATAQVVRAELADELAALHEKLAASLEHVGDLIQAGLTDRSGSARFSELLIAAKRTHGTALGDLERLAGLTKRLRDGSTIKSALAARCDVVRAVDAMVRILRPEIERDGTLEVQVRGTPAVRIDAASLGTVVMQLLINAAQARGDRPKDRHRIAVAVEAIDDEAVVSVSDNGVGIPSDVRERLFDPRFSTKSEGDGLGLAIVRDIVGSAHGSVEVFSEIGIGTTFTVKLPIARP
jgi:signal transduction histidine kinase